MDGWTKERVDKWVNGRVNGRADERAEGRADERVDGQVNERVDGRVNSCDMHDAYDDSKWDRANALGAGKAIKRKAAWT